ncbi:MAG: HAD-IIB family hydrolase [Methyloligellaceae bacterium]
MPTPRALSTCPVEVWRGIRGVLTDIDDTLTTDGRITADVFSAMERLRASQRLTIPITGRPAGWCDMIARQWPVDAVVGENGAFYFRYDRTRRRMVRCYADPEHVRAENQLRLKAISVDILAAVPGAGISADQAYRETDLAIDLCEDVEPLPKRDIDDILDIFARHGATAKVSSIHVNGWFGNYDKLAMTKQLMLEQFSIDLDREPERFVFAGDSPNDAPMFGFFPNAVGVANLKIFLSQCDASPAWITRGECGEGFVELVDRILGADEGPDPR